MYVCMHTCMYAGMDACMHVCMYVCIHACMYAYMHVSVCAYVRVCAQVVTPSLYTHKNSLNDTHRELARIAMYRLCVCARVRACACACVRACTCVCVCARACISSSPSIQKEKQHTVLLRARRSPSICPSCCSVQPAVSQGCMRNKESDVHVIFMRCI